MAKKVQKRGKRKTSVKKSTKKKTAKKKTTVKRKAAKPKARPVVRKPAKSMGPRKSPVAAVLLELLLGWVVLGLGHLYVGRIGRGILFMLGYWVVVIIEAIVFFSLAFNYMLKESAITLIVSLIINIAIIITSAVLAYKEAKAY